MNECLRDMLTYYWNCDLVDDCKKWKFADWKKNKENTTYACWDTSSNSFKRMRNEIVLAHGQGISELEY